VPLDLRRRGAEQQPLAASRRHGLPKTTVCSFQVGHRQFFARLLLILPGVPAHKVEAAEDSAGNRDDRGQEDRRIEYWAEHSEPPPCEHRQRREVPEGHSRN
jgi:hypothetical protein